jgi:hypothetical protein
VRQRTFEKWFVNLFREGLQRSDVRRQVKRRASTSGYSLRAVVPRARSQHNSAGATSTTRGARGVRVLGS